MSAMLTVALIVLLLACGTTEDPAQNSYVDLGNEGGIPANISFTTEDIAERALLATDNLLDIWG